MCRTLGAAAFCASSKGEKRTQKIEVLGVSRTTWSRNWGFPNFSCSRKAQGLAGLSLEVTGPLLSTNKDFQPVQFWGGEGDYRSLLCKKTPPFFLKTLYFSIKPVQTGTEKNLILFGSSIKNKPPFLYGNAAPTVFANVQLLASNCSLKISQSSWSECN